MILTSNTLPDKIVYLVPPTIVDLSKRYAVIGGVWFEIDESVTLDMLRSRHVSPVKQVIKVDSITWKSYEATSSTGKGTYEVRQYNTGSWSCTCPAYGFKRKCKHIDHIKTTL